MPELPEVETTVLQLRPKVIKKTLVDVWTDFPKIIKKPPSFEDFKRKIKNKRIQNLWRVGKNIIFGLSENFLLLIHQKLTGHLLYGKWKFVQGKWEAKIEGSLKNDPMNRFLHLIFFLDNGYQIALSDLRKFAKVELGLEPEMKNSLAKLGPDPLKIDFYQFKKILQQKRGKIKKVLMNQEVISGVGNIYSDEVLFEAKIYPFQEIKDLTQEELKRIFQTLKKILKKAIELQGESISDYRTPEGEKGRFDKIRKVYRREGERCLRCKAVIKRIKIGGRSTYFCPQCQKIPY